MAVTFAVYDEDVVPTVDRLKFYLEAIDELQGQPVQGMLIEYPITCDEMFYGKLFRCNDEHIHSDNFFVIFVHQRNRAKISDNYLKAMAAVIGTEVQFWVTQLAATSAGTGVAPNGCTVVKMEVNARLLSDLTAQARRNSMKAISGSKA